MTSTEMKDYVDGIPFDRMSVIEQGAERTKALWAVACQVAMLREEISSLREIGVLRTLLDPSRNVNVK